MIGQEKGFDRRRAAEVAVGLYGTFGAVEHSVRQMQALMQRGDEEKAAMWVDIAFAVAEQRRG